MNLVILSRSRRLHSTRRLYLCGLARRHSVRIVDPLRCSLVLGPDSMQLLVQGEPIGPVDAVIPRLAARTGMAGLAVLRQFELAGAYCLNSSEAYARGRDKLRTLQLLCAAGVPVLPTAFARHPDDVQRVLAQIGGAPCVVKFTEGTQGLGVMLAESSLGAASIIEALHAVKRDLILQKFVSVDGDARLIVIGNEVAAAMVRRPRPGDFRANLHRGGDAVVLHPDRQLQSVAVRAARAVGLECAGVDVVITDQGPAVLEVNASPGLQGIESASGRNVALQIVRHIETSFVTV
ncbi:MAG: RimK family alpha-L-glutamate ligase [Acidobacteriota bacterium]